MTIVIAMFASCDSSIVSIRGKITCNSDEMVYLEMVRPGESIIVDSTHIDEDGEFKLRVKLPEDAPIIYNLRMDDCNEIVPLLLDKGEVLEINSVGHIARNHIINGSEGSELMYEISSILKEGALSLDSLGRAFLEEQNQVLKDSLTRQYVDLYYSIKRRHLNFVVANVNSIAAVYALYQRLPNDEILFMGDSDIVYYRMVADSVRTKYPNSPYLMSLEGLIKEHDNKVRVADLIKEGINDAKSYPEIELPDMYGNIVKMSDSHGKVILLDFWSAEIPACNIINAELKTIYEQYAGDGLEVFQVSADTSKANWVKAVQEQKLPWISLCDFKGQASPAVVVYNIKSIPANFLIDKSGNIVAQNVYGEELKKELKKLL